MDFISLSNLQNWDDCTLTFHFSRNPRGEFVPFLTSLPWLLTDSSLSSSSSWTGFSCLLLSPGSCLSSSSPSSPSHDSHFSFLQSVICCGKETKETKRRGKSPVTTRGKRSPSTTTTRTKRSPSATRAKKSRRERTRHADSD